MPSAIHLSKSLKKQGSSSRHRGLPACDAIRIDTIDLEYADRTKETIVYNQTTHREEHF